MNTKSISAKITGKFILFFFIVLSFSCSKEDTDVKDLNSKSPDKNQNTSNELLRLLGDSRFFEVRDMLKTVGSDYNNRDILFYRAIVKSIFDETDSSIILFDRFLDSARIRVSKKQLLGAFNYQAFNFWKKSEWEKSVQLLDEILIKYPQILDEKGRGIVLNMRNSYMVESLAKTSYRKKSAGFEMDLIKTDPKRIAVRILINGIEGDFILDTGAQINSIPEKNVKKFGIKKLTDTIFTSTPRGRKGGISAIAESLVLGNLDVINPTFLIYSDKDTPPIYSFDGVIGYPTLRQLGKIMIDFKEFKIGTTDKELSSINQNLCYSGKGSVISARTGQNMLCFAFDTGAYWTLLYKTNYTNRGQFQLKTKVDSSGDSRKYRKAADMNIEVSHRKFELKNVTFLNSSMSTNTSGLDGVFGVQALKNYNRIYLDFSNLIIEFE